MAYCLKIDFVEVNLHFWSELVLISYTLRCLDSFDHEVCLELRMDGRLRFLEIEAANVLNLLCGAQVQN